MSSDATRRPLRGIDFDRVRAALATPPLEIVATEPIQRAAVAAILRPTDGDLEVLLIRRTERAEDPWSGHMAFPGGRRDARDADLQTTAMRETLEEVGLDLAAHGELLGKLDDVVPGGSRGVMNGLVVSPFVWGLRTRPALVPNTVEVAEIHWAPLRPLLLGERDTTYPFVWRGQPMYFPGYRVGDGECARVVWGMTYRVLERFFERLRSALEQP